MIRTVSVVSRCCSLLSLVFSVPLAYAELEGSYFGLDLNRVHHPVLQRSLSTGGTITLDGDSMFLSDGTRQAATASNIHGFGQRFFFGYQFNENFAIESGFQNFPNARWMDASDRWLRHRLSSFDLGAKARLPFNDYFSGSLHAGGAYLHSSTETHPNFTIGATAIKPILYNEAQSPFALRFGLGLDYEMDRGELLHLGFSRVTSDSVKHADSIGISWVHYFSEKIDEDF